MRKAIILGIAFLILSFHTIRLEGAPLEDDDGGECKDETDAIAACQRIAAAELNLLEMKTGSYKTKGCYYYKSGKHAGKAWFGTGGKPETWNSPIKRGKKNKSAKKRIEITCGQTQTLTVDVDCVMGSWSPWSKCTKTCGSGTQDRTRSVTTQQVGAGAACGSTSEQQPCNTDDCPVDCVMSEWSAWSTCSGECGSASQSRTRSIITQNFGSGTACGSSSEKQACTAEVACSQACFTNYELVTGNRPGVGIIGAYFLIASTEHCAHLCNAHDKCFSYEWSPSANICHLHEASDPSLPDNYSDYRYCRQTAKPTCPEGFTVIEGDIMGWGWHGNSKHEVTTLDDCAKLCLAKDGCCSIEYSPTDEICVMETYCGTSALQTAFRDYIRCKLTSLLTDVEKEIVRNRS